ncbi:MAG: pyridoxal 5'-phosphate synthase glutaminase subunit PdxT [Acholeplasmataceae bacterium]|jgi:5'-phosphate synthase pdxT subunit|nr:pyridoxal 5'-phosphate synthase glutaminase subunit PdxT [Acholeplasmataceae bacterium]
MTIGILAVQGAFIEHEHILNQLHVSSFEIRKKEDLDQPMDGIILPGGESTAMGKLLRDLDMLDTLKEKIAQGLPTLGTCAGMILLAKSLYQDPTVHLGLMDMVVARNGYGRQLSSFHTQSLFNHHMIPMTFIRAPYIVEKGHDVIVLSSVNERIVAVRQNHMLATSFHPELTSDHSVHKYFLKMITSSS